MKLIDVGICLIDAQVNSFFQRSIPLNDTHTVMIIKMTLGISLSVQLN